MGSARSELGAGRGRRRRGVDHVGHRSRAPRAGSGPTHRHGNRGPISRARSDRADDARGDAGGTRPDRGRHRRPLPSRPLHRPGVEPGLGLHRRPVRDSLPLRVLARMVGAPRASRRPRGDPDLFCSCHKCRQRGESRSRRPARGHRRGARNRRGRGRLPGIARRSVGCVSHHGARRSWLAVRYQRRGCCSRPDDRRAGPPAGIDHRHLRKALSARTRRRVGREGQRTHDRERPQHHRLQRTR